MRQRRQETRDLIDIRKHIEVLKIKLTHLSRSTVNLIVVFSLQTILLPLFVLWLLMGFLRSTHRLVLAPSPSGIIDGQALATNQLNDAGQEPHSD